MLGGLLFFLSMATASLPLQMGDTWDREPLKEVSDAKIRNLAVSVGRIEVELSRTSTSKELEVGTAFVVGQRKDEFIMATNHHVMPKRLPCMVYFTAIKSSASCQTFLGTWKNIELTLFTVKVTKKKTAEVLKNAILELDGPPLLKGYKLFTMGYGYYNNKKSQLTVERSDYCQIFSNHIQYVPANAGHGAYSFAHACEISTSDSGAPIFDAETGRVVGIQWAATVRDSQNVVSESYLEQLLQSDQGTWNSLNYAVPAQYILEKLSQI